MTHRWWTKFEKGRGDMRDEHRTRKPITATEDDVETAVRQIVANDRRLTIDLLFEILACLPSTIEVSRTSVIRVKEELSFRKVSARWVPRLPSKNHQQHRLTMARKFVEMVGREDEELYSRICNLAILSLTPASISDDIPCWVVLAHSSTLSRKVRKPVKGSGGLRNAATRRVAFLMSQEGYDVWLPNHRGTPYSNQHINLTFSDSEYWNF
ncbi:hypothetical protein NQ318_016329, partial [Aromia moschata]